jgi:hypothetical protein
LLKLADPPRLEYVTKDCVCIYNPVDERFCYITDMETRKIIGFQFMLPSEPKPIPPFSARHEFSLEGTGFTLQECGCTEGFCDGRTDGTCIHGVVGNAGAPSITGLLPPERAAILTDYYDRLINPKSQRQGRFNKLAGQVLDVDGARNQAEGVMSMFGLDRLLGFHLHRHESPWEDAPPWAIELRQMLRILLREEDYLMNVQSDIALALAKVSDDVAKQTTVVAGMKVYVQGLKDQIATLAAASTDTETAGALNALASQIEANTQSDADALVVNTPADPAVASEDKPAAAAADPAPMDLNPNAPKA